MDFVLNVIFEVIGELLLIYPGAFLRWLFFGRKQKIDGYLQKGKAYNFIISFSLILGLGLLITKLF